MLPGDYQFGATLLAPDRARFRLWAPSIEHVSVEITGRASVAMQAMGDGWFEAEVACEAGTRYRYRLTDQLLVPDPASRLQDGDVHDPSIVVDPDAYQWHQAGWRGRPWHEAVIYELHVGACGGFAGVRALLPHLAEIGITALELMPIADFPGGRNWGYDGVLLYAPDTAYGSPDELKAVIDDAHALGLMVFLDVVYNHFGPDGNYLSTYARRFFRDDVHTPWGAAIDFRQKPVRDFFIENALYWLREYRFDGLRFDAVHAITDVDFVEELGGRIREVMAAEEPARMVHLILENEDNRASYLAGDFDAQWNDDAHHVLHTMLTGERHGYYADYAVDAAAGLARTLAEGFIYQGQTSSYRNGETRGTPSAHLPSTAFVLFLQNHDQIGNRAFGERLHRFCPPQALRTAIALQLLSPQIPMLFMGEEWGAVQPFLYFTSHHGELAEAVRKGRRDEFETFPDFSDAAENEEEHGKAVENRRAKITDPNLPATFEASIPRRDPAQRSSEGGWESLYRTLLMLRRSFITPYLPATHSLGASVIGPAAVLARWKLGSNLVLNFYINLGEASLSAPAFTRRWTDKVIYESVPQAADSLAQGALTGWTMIAILEKTAR